MPDIKSQVTLKAESYLTADETAAYLKVRRDTVYRLARAGQIPSVRVGRQWRFRERDHPRLAATWVRRLVRRGLSEDLLAKRRDQLLGKMWADASDHAAAEVLLDTIEGAGRHDLEEGRPELNAVLSVVIPPAAGLDRSA